MGDVPYPPEPEPTEAEVRVEQVKQIVEKVDTLYRAAVTGDAHGRARRATLFILCAIGIGLGLPVIALPALLALALTDAVVDL